MRALLTKYDAAFSLFYIKLKPNASVQNVQKSLSDIQHRYLDKRDEKRSGQLDLYLLRFADSYYYNPEHFWDGSEKGNKLLLYSMIALGFFILFIGVSSYVILFTALSILRFKEIGLRKVVGAKRSSLLFQSITEAVLTCAVALLPTFVLVELVRPVVNGFSGKTIIGHYWSSPLLIGCFLMLVLLVGLIAGLYTAWGIMRYNPVEAIRGGAIKVKGKSRVRFVLLMFQLTIFIGFMVATFVFNGQLRYATHLGVRSSNILLVPLSTKPLQDAYPLLKQELKALPWISQVSGSMIVPPSILTLGVGFDNVDISGNVVFQALFVDVGFAEMFNLELVDGSYIAGANQDEGRPMLLTEKAAKLFKRDNLIGYTSDDLTVVGIVKDISAQSVRTEEQPLVIIYDPSMVQWLAVKVSDNAPVDCTAQIEQLIKSKVADVSSVITTMEDYVAELYTVETKLSKLLSLLSFISISLAIMGLFGLSLFTLEQRTKEIGVRKISGASTSEILVLLFREYAWLVLAALVLAVPLSWFLLEKWLNTFAYHTSIQIWYYVVAAALALVLVLLSILYQALRVARRNPVESLKYK